MMKKFATFFSCLFSFFLFSQVEALSNFAQIYPSIMQYLNCSYIFRGDRQGDFKEDPVAVLSDGSAWKVHPDSANTYMRWKVGDAIHVAVRTDFYWFKREHKFLLCNDNLKESVKVMLVQHKTYPLKINATEFYYKSKKPIYRYVIITKTDANGKPVQERVAQYCGDEPSDPRKILYLSDGSVWVIKNRLNDFQLGMNVYIGAQGMPKRYYDFIIIAGTEREAIWTFARPQI